MRATFEVALLNKRKYPLVEFRVLARAARKCIGLAAADPLIHRKVSGEISGLADYLRLERKRVPDDEVLHEAERLQCPLFSGYDPCLNLKNRRAYDNVCAVRLVCFR